MVHAHIMFSDMEGKAYGGHLMGGTKVFSLEVFIQELTGDPKVRKLEKATQLLSGPIRSASNDQRLV